MFSSAIPEGSSSKMKFDEMPWSYVGTHPELMEFNAFTTESRRPYIPNNAHTKRKSDDNYPIPTKQLITEEKMAAHLMGLHISSDYKSYADNTAASSSAHTTEILDINMDGDCAGTSYKNNIRMTPEELERRLKKAQKITLCEEVRKLGKPESILPKVLLDRIEKPCTALVVWKPPQNIDRFIFTNAQKNFNFTNRNQDHHNIFQDNNAANHNNNNNNIANNNNNYDELYDEGIDVEDEETDENEMYNNNNNNEVNFNFNNGDDGDDGDDLNFNDNLMDM